MKPWLINILFILGVFAIIFAALPPAITKLILGCIIISSGIWVYIDAKKLNIGKYKKTVLSLSNYPFGAAFLVWILWIIAFPMYISYRQRILDGKISLKEGVDEISSGKIMKVMTGEIVLEKGSELVKNKSVTKNKTLFFIAFGIFLIGIASFLVVRLTMPIYDPDVAKVFIHERLTNEEKQRLDENDILDIIETEFKYLQEKGEINDDTVKYIQNEAKKTGHDYSTNDINRVFDIEMEYQKSIE